MWGYTSIFIIYGMKIHGALSLLFHPIYICHGFLYILCTVVLWLIHTAVSLTVATDCKIPSERIHTLVPVPLPLGSPWQRGYHMYHASCMIMISASDIIPWWKDFEVPNVRGSTYIFCASLWGPVEIAWLVTDYISSTWNVFYMFYMTRVQLENGCPHSRNTLIFWW